MALRTSVNHLALTKPQPSALVGAYVELSQLLALRHSAQKGTVQQQQRDRPSIRSQAVQKLRGVALTLLRYDNIKPGMTSDQ